MLTRTITKLLLGFMLIVPIAGVESCQNTGIGSPGVSAGMALRNLTDTRIQGSASFLLNHVGGPHWVGVMK